MDLNEFQQRCLETAGNVTEKDWQYYIDIAKDWDDEYGTWEKNGMEAIIAKLEDQIIWDEILHRAMGVAGEAGEVIEKIKKVQRNQVTEFASEEEKVLNPKLITKQNVASEIGDVMWYCVTMLDLLGYKADDVAGELLDKLAERKEQGTIKSSGDNNKDR